MKRYTHSWDTYDALILLYRWREGTLYDAGKEGGRREVPKSARYVVMWSGEILHEKGGEA